MKSALLFSCAVLCPSNVAYFQEAGKDASEPVTFEFKRKSGPSAGRKDAFDPKTQTYHLHVEDIARFEIKKVNTDLAKHAVILKITGMLDKAEEPLTLRLPDKAGKKREFTLHHEGFDKDLFRIERKDGLTTIEFLPKGRALLAPGVWFQYVDFFR
jgi:hypothetical protein